MKALVTGASGFLGGELARQLLAAGHSVVANGRREMPELERLGARVARFDLGDREALRNACKGVEVIFHAAAKTGVWGRERDYHAANVVATENVIAAAQARQVRRLVFTSSPSVVFGEHEHVEAGNDLPYPARYLCAYPKTKALAERLVLGADGRFGLTTCALRPHLIFGARDPHLIPRLIERARRRKLVRVGDGANRVTVCAVENAAHAHVLAAAALAPGAPHAGRAFFIGQERPVVLWSWIAELLARLGLPPIERSVAAGTAYALGAACEATWKALGRTSEPPLTRFVARQLAWSHCYDMRPANAAFGYGEVVSTEAAVAAVVSALRR